MNELIKAIAATLASLAIPAGELSASAVPEGFPDLCVTIEWRRWSNDMGWLVLTVEDRSGSEELSADLLPLYRLKVELLCDGDLIRSDQFHAGVQPTFVLVPGERYTAFTSFVLKMNGRGWVMVEPSVGPGISMNSRYTLRLEVPEPATAEPSA